MARRMGMDWLWLSLIAGGAGWAGYAGAVAAKKAAAEKAAAEKAEAEKAAADAADAALIAPTLTDAALREAAAPGQPGGYWGGVGGPSFGTGGMGPRPDFAMGYQPWQAGTTVAAITGGSLGY